MDTTFKDTHSAHNVHFVKCADCHRAACRRSGWPGAERRFLPARLAGLSCIVWIHFWKQGGGGYGRHAGIGRALRRRGGLRGSVAICGRSEAGSRRRSGTWGRRWSQGSGTCRIREVRALFEFVVERLGGLDILVNNAGLGLFSSVAETSIENWQRTIGVNLNGAFYCSREARPAFASRGGGSSSTSAVWPGRILSRAGPL